MWKIDRRKDDW
jgi:hypothetical protein